MNFNIQTILIEEEIAAEKERLEGDLRAFKIKLLAISLAVIFLVLFAMWMLKGEASAGFAATAVVSIFVVGITVWFWFAPVFVYIAGVAVGLVPIVVCLSGLATTTAAVSIYVAAPAIVSGVVYGFFVVCAASNSIELYQEKIDALDVCTDYNDLLALKDASDAVAQYIQSVGSSGREITKFEYSALKSFIDSERQAVEKDKLISEIYGGE